ncbi:MAG: penicillin-binding transpeptidase domain-containing protein [Verrucomicrobiota bacterium]
MVTHFKVRLYLLALFLIAGMGLLVYRLYLIQVNEHEYYAKRVPGSRYQTVRVPGIRGEIKDRNGLTLVDSTPNYELQFNLREIVEDALKGAERKALHHYIIDGEEVKPHEYTRYDSGGQKQDKSELDVVKLVELTVFPELQQLGLLADYSSNAMRVHYRTNRGIVPFTYRRELSFKEFARFAENNLGIPGVTVTRTGRRRYFYDSLGCHILGYMNRANPDQVDAEKKKEFTYYVGDAYGVQGVESTMDSYLQGNAGSVMIERNEKGKFVREVSQTDPQSGGDVFLTLDARIQLVTEQSLRAVGRGAAVVVDPRNGDILAMASVPSFNPNVFIPEVSIEDWKRYSEDPTSPLFNRAVSPAAPGSTAKIPIALSGCLSDSWSERFLCGAGAQYGRKFMKCHCAGKGYTHGNPNVSEAIKSSCNGFFYRYANDTGIRNIETVTSLLGMGRTTGIQITGEKPGNIPNPEWLRQQGLNWSDAFTALTSIGQGATEATPLQMACVTAWSANGGKVFQPRIIKKVQEADGSLSLENKPLIKHDFDQRRHHC